MVATVVAVTVVALAEMVAVELMAAVAAWPAVAVMAAMVMTPLSDVTTAVAAVVTALLAGMETAPARMNMKREGWHLACARRCIIGCADRRQQRAG